MKNINILQINTSDYGGGAEKFSLDLHNYYQNIGINSTLAVGKLSKEIDDLFPLLHDQYQLDKLPSNKLIRYLLRLSRLDWPALLRWAGFEDIYYPKNKNWQKFIQTQPDILHVHNFHGGFFDLNSLINLSKEYPILVTLHDEWLLTGHCAYTINCNHWLNGCGNCPDLNRYPGIHHDRTKINYRIKNNILKKSTLFMASPSNWLLSQLEKTNITPIFQKAIPNGVNQSIFHERNRNLSRKKLGFKNDEIVILYVAAQGEFNPYKDFYTIKKAIEILSKLISINLTFVKIGGKNSSISHLDNIKTIELPFIQDPHQLSDYYRAADLFLHAALADNFPTTILEALSCGTPVIATAIGGIPEQIIDQVTGF